MYAYTFKYGQRAAFFVVIILVLITLEVLL
ncbi:hypothetical protein DEHRE_13320 [Dehalobacter restrictus DSM 9455]|uniref:Uncharacterized protein n=1 Tax=Dehalobacter restrictus (strain DSM 9455 / PER-K23) TaxID=871738 RepID=A0ABN4BVS1_DEHRP|nr:hypothetical protein DEHRE_13320 [Dehalobacter restrictus DSM 9455]